MPQSDRYAPRRPFPNYYPTRCSYNQLNSKPMCANPELLTATLRDSWNFTGG
jgi:beta-glucosidase-like glycosyl hydrolase